MKLLDPFLKVKNGHRNVFEIILWWELRRILYNLIVLIGGVVSIIIIGVAASTTLELEPGEDLFEPFAVFIFAFLCNIGYTLGWLTEVFKKHTITYGPKMFRTGLYFTLFWVFLPANIWLIFAVVNLIKKLF